MFGKKKSAGIHRAKFGTLIAKDVHLTGNLEFSDGLRLDGRVTGNITGKSGTQTLLVLSERGVIMGNVHGYDVIVNGAIVGDVLAEHFLELQANAKVTGNIEYEQLRMDCGATVAGTLTKREATLASSAVKRDEPSASDA